jgi:hypothetical protein
VTRFRVYPKREGKPFEIEIHRFEYQADGLVLYDTTNRASNEGYLNLDNIAAVVPEPSLNAPTNRSYVTFNIHLKGYEDEPIAIAANELNYDDEFRLLFSWLLWDDEKDHLKPFPLKNLYIAKSEVIAVIPDDGLQANR